MNVSEVINITRKTALMDYIPPYQWEDDELIFCLNRAFNELIKMPLIKDQTTTAITRIKLLSNVGAYAYDSRVLQIDNARFLTNVNYGPLNKTTEGRLDKTISNWRNETGIPREYVVDGYSGYITIYPKFDSVGEVVGSSNISFNFVTMTISQTSGDLSAFAVGDEINVSGTTNNDVYFTVVTAGTTSIVVSGTMTMETNTSATLRKVRDTLLLSVKRLGATRFVVSDIENDTVISELRDDQAEGLIDGIAKRAFLKPHSQTLDPNKAEHHRGLFEEFKKGVKRDLILLNKPDRSRVPRSGSSIYY